MNNLETGNMINCYIKLQKQMYPKKDKVDSGDWCVLTAEITKLIEGDPKIHPIFNTITLVGNFPIFNFSEEYKFIGKETFNKQYNSYQYEILYFGKPMNTKNEDDQKVFLSYILSEKQVNNLYKELDNPFDIIKNQEVDKLTKVKGIGLKTAFKIIEKYKCSIDLSDVYVQLNQYGLTKNMINKLTEKYGSPQIVIDKIKSNPYVLITDVEGIGWKTADEIALKGGTAENSPNRIKGSIIHILNEKANEGYSYIDPYELLDEMENNLGYIDFKDLSSVIQKMYDNKILWHNSEKGKTTKVALMKYYNLEQNVSNELKRINNAKNNFNINNWEDEIKDIEKEQGWQFTDEQLQAIKLALENQIVMITGGAGVGKTATISAIVKVLSKYKIGQCALSGRAASRMSELSGQEGSTIHRLLNYDPKSYKFIYDKENQLEEDIIIVDEISMVGGYLFYDLIQAIKDGAKLILVGDMHQLEAIGCMNIAKDIMSSNLIKTIELTKIHRQATKSGIKTESIKIKNKEPIFNSKYSGHEFKGELKDFEIDIADNKQDNLDKIIRYFKKYYQVSNNITEVQVIVPIKQRGECCTFNINNEIQKIYNPQSKNKNEIKIHLTKDKFYTLRENDKIIVTKNNYKVVDEDGIQVAIFNGQQGIINKIDTEEELIYLDMPYVSNKKIVIGKGDLQTIQLAYAVTTHKSQGSQYDYVITCVDYSTPPMMLTKELVYTSITRSKKHCVLIGQNKALYKAMTTSFVSKKHTFLKDMLDNNKIN